MFGNKDEKQNRLEQMVEISVKSPPPDCPYNPRRAADR